MKHFSNKYRVVAIDARGYGLSSKPHFVADYRSEVLAGDIADIIEQLGYESCVLVGHDWGGMIAWMTAILYPHLVEKLIIMNCPHPSAFLSAMTLRQLARSWYMYFFQCPFIPELLLKSDDYAIFKMSFLKKPMGLVNTKNMEQEDIEVFRYTFAQEGTPKAALNYYRAMFRYQTDLSRSQVTAPTLLLWGVNDGALGEELADASANFCADIRTRKIANCSHWVQQDRPEDCNKYMDLFLNEHTQVQNVLDY